MAKTNRKAVYVQPKHHQILRRMAYEQECNISDILDMVLEQTDWSQVEKKTHEITSK
ncbi:MAG: hypothetical protein AAGA16_14120 [Cyanobacteria bacterium P01_E01_bin.35]